MTLLCVSIIILSMSISYSEVVSFDLLLEMKAAITKDLNGSSQSHIIPLSSSTGKAVSDREKFLAGSYSFYTKKNPVYVIVSSLSQMEFGNHFGHVINELACAFKSRLHAIVIDQKFDTLFHDENGDAGMKLVEELCKLRIHPNPAKKLRNAKAIVRKECNCDMYCWEDNKAPWIDFVLPLRELMNRGLTSLSFKAHVQSSHSFGEDQEVSMTDPIASAMTITTSSISNATSVISNIELNLVPSVAIQFRCSDNFKHNMGFLPFQAIMDRIDTHWNSISSKKREKLESLSDVVQDKVHIYILTEHPKRLINSPLSGICPAVISRLQHELSLRYRDSIVSVQRGMMFQTWYQFLHADLVICSASTFCLWPALSNMQGFVYLPMTTLFANKTAVDFGVANIHFIEDYDLFGVDASTMNGSYVANILSTRNWGRRNNGGIV